jgi:hypothetical protein
MAYQRGFPASGIVSDNNSTSAILQKKGELIKWDSGLKWDSGIQWDQSSSQWVGTPDEVLEYAEITFFSFSDVSSDTDGVSLEFSTDRVNWDDKTKITAIGGSVLKKILPVTARWLRVVYNNGGSAQSQFRLQTIYNRSKNKDLTNNLNSSISDSSDVSLVKSIISGKNQFGEYEDVGSYGGRLEVESRDTDTYNILNRILIQLKKLNLQMSFITDISMDDGSTED